MLLLEDKLNVAWQGRPFSGQVYRAALPQGLTCAEIIGSVPDIDTRRFLQVGTLCVNGEAVPREMWPYVRPKSRADIIVTLHMPIHGGQGRGGKDIVRILAAIALVVVATAVTAGAAAPLLGANFAAGTLGAQILAGAITLGGALLLGAFVKPPAKAVDDATEEDKGGTAALQGNQLKRGGPIPRVAGFHRVFPPFLSQPLVDLDEYDEVVEGVYGLAGPHQIRDIKFGEVLADDIDPEQFDYQFYELSDDDGGIDDTVQIMAFFAGTQDSVAFTDSSFYVRNLIASGDGVFIDKREGYINNAAAYFAGTHFIEVAATPDFVLGDGDFSVDFWFEADGDEGTTKGLCGQRDSGSDPANTSMSVHRLASGVIEFRVSDGSGFTDLITTTNVDSGRHHFMGVRSGNTLLAFVDGVLQASAAFTGTVPSSSETMKIGDGGVNLPWLGWISNFRYTVGNAWKTSNFTPPEVRYKPIEPTLVTRYGKTAQLGILLSAHHLANDQPTQATRDLLSNQVVPSRSIPQPQSIVARGRGFDEVWVTLTFNSGLFYTDDNFERDWFNGLPFRVRVRALGSDEWFNCPEIHVHDRRSAPFSRMLVFRWDSDFEMPGGIPTRAPAARKGWRAAYYSVPVQDETPSGIGGWTAHSHFYAGTGDTYFVGGFSSGSGEGGGADEENLNATGLRNVRLTTEKVEFFLDGLIDKGPIEVEIRRGQLYIADKFDYTTYELNTNPPDDDLGDGIFDLFGYATMDGDQVLILKKSNAADEVTISRVATVWNAAPIARKGEFAAIYVRVTGRSLEALSVLGAGLVPDWDGEAWTGQHATSNPAPHYRDVLIGDLNDNRIPESLVNDSVLLEWRQRCANLEFACNAVFDGEDVKRVLEVIASCGYARPRQSEVWDVAQDRDFTSIPPTQVFTPRNMRGFRWEKAFVRHRPDGLRVRFNDAEDNYVERTMIVPRLGVIDAQPGRLEEIRYEGITDELQAILKALYDQQQVIDRFTFYYGEVDVEQLVCRRGDLVLVQHDILDQYAGFSRVLDVEVTDGDVTSIQLDGSVSPIDSFFTTPTLFFDTPTEFFTNNVGAAIRLKDGTVASFEAQLSGDGFFMTPTPALSGIDADVLERECLVTTGKLLRANRRMLVYDVKPRADLTAEITFVDEAPQLWQFPEPLELAEAFMRNRIINGDMRLDRVNEGSVYSLTDGTLEQTLDHWYALSLDSVGSDVAFEVQQISNDWPPGFSHYQRVEVVNDVPNPQVAADEYYIGAAVRVNNFGDFGWGLSTGRAAALSFMVRSSVTGTFSVAVFLDGLASYVASFSIPAANTWFRRIITIPAPVLQTSPSITPEVAPRVEFSLGGGAMATSNANQWVAGDFRRLDDETALVATLGATFDITGVQLEIAPATQFEWLPIEALTSLVAGRLEPGFVSIRYEQGSDTDHDINFLSGEARDSGDLYDIILSSTLTKQIDATWAAGNNQGGMFTGSVGNNTIYYLFVIEQPDTGSVDAGFDTSPTGANVPAGYTRKQRIGWVRTDGSANIRAFVQATSDLDETRYVTPVQDVAVTNQGESTTSYVLSVPPTSEALIRAGIIETAAFQNAVLLIRPLTEADQVPVVQGLGSLIDFGSGYYSHTFDVGEFRVETNALSQIAARVSDITDNTIGFYVGTKGAKFRRGLIP